MRNARIPIVRICRRFSALPWLCGLVLALRLCRGHSTQRTQNLPPETRCCPECAGNGTSASHRMSRALYYVRHRTLPKVFPVTHVLFLQTVPRGQLPPIPELCRAHPSGLGIGSIPLDPFEFPYISRLNPHFSPLRFLTRLVFDESRPSGDNRRVASLQQVGLWRSWERASMAWKRSSVRSRSGPPITPTTCQTGKSADPACVCLQC